MVAVRDPTTGFTDMQWYLYRQRNVAFFGAFTSRAFSTDDLVAAARGLIALAPQLGAGFPDLSDELLHRLIYRERVTTLDGFPDRWIDRGDEIFSDPSLPLFRIRHAAADQPAAEGRAGFLLVQVSHALVEGADSAYLARSQSAMHPLARRGSDQALLMRAAATGLGAALACLHLLAGNLVSLHPGPFGYASRVYPRRLFSSLARHYDVRQRALFFALVMHTVYDAGTARGKRSLSAAYSVIDNGGGADRDAYMRMRMRFASFDNRDSFGDYVRAVDKRLAAEEAQEAGFNETVNARAIRLHRAMSRIVPFAYTAKLFQFMPYDIVIGLIPPHWVGSGLTRDLLEPVYAGAALQGANGCVIVPGRRQVSFNFYIQNKFLPRMAVLDAVLAEPVISRSDSVA